MNNWTDKEFETYVLLYAAQSNFIETDEESDFILSKIDTKIYNSIHNEIVHDTDIVSKQKIKEFLINNKLSDEQKTQLLRDVKEVLFADGTVDYLEKNVYTFLKSILV